MEIVIYVSAKYFLLKLMSSMDWVWSPKFTTIGNFIRDHSWRGIYFIGLGTAYGAYFLADSFLREINELKIDSIKNEKDRLKMELAFLRSQINPHFIFNILGNIHNRVMKYSQESGDAIVMLSELMRYALTDINKDGLVLISSEIEHIENYIKLNQFRFNGNGFVRFQTSGNLDEVKIIPHVLLTLIENIFKYGVLDNENDPASLVVLVDHSKLSIKAENKKSKLIRKDSHGIGLNNLRARLSNIYGSNHLMVINDQEDKFSVQIEIWLKI